MDENYYIWKDFSRFWRFVTAPFWGHRDKKKYKVRPDMAHYRAPRFPKRLPYLRSHKGGESR